MPAIWSALGRSPGATPNANGIAAATPRSARRRPSPRSPCRGRASRSEPAARPGRRGQRRRARAEEGSCRPPPRPRPLPRPRAADSASTVSTCSAPGGQAAEEVAERPRTGSRRAPAPIASTQSRRAAWPRRRRAGSRGRARPPRPCGRRAVVMGGDRVQQLGARVRVERRPRAPRSGAGRGGRGRAAGPRRSARKPGRARARARGRRRAGARRRAAGRRAAAGAAARSRGERRDADRVLEQPAGVAVVPLGGRQRAQRRASSPSARNRADDAARPGCAISAARNSRKPSSSSASRRMRGRERRPGSASAASTERTSSWSRSRNRSTRPSTRTASPSTKRPSSSSTSFQTRASIRPLGSTSSSARYAAPFRVRSRCLRATA